MTAEPVPAAPSFDAMNLSEPLRRALEEVGYLHPTPVQMAVFEPIAAGRDVVVQSKTGSGKTAAFAIPLLDRVIQPEKRVQAMVLCPTRELALQVAGEITRLGKYKGIGVTAVYGGASMTKQIEELEAGAQVVSGTPGRVLDHLRRGTLDVSGLRAICLDEADEMLSMGFAEELNAILEFVPKKRQTLLFSATMPEQIQRLARRHLTEPENILLSTDRIAPTEVEHFVYFVGLSNRTRELARILEVEEPTSAIVFCNTRDEAAQVARELQRLGIDADFITGDLEQAARERVMGAFRTGQIKYLVATDVAARGIDISNVSHVINYGFPESAEVYVHRTGRTGRAGRRGTAISLIGAGDVGNLYMLRLTYGIRPIERALPSAAEERTRREIDRINLLREAFAAEPSDEALSLARRLLTHDESEKIVASLLSEFFDIASRQAIAQGIGPLATAAPPPTAAAPESPRPAAAEARERCEERPRPERRERREEGPRPAAREERPRPEGREDRPRPRGPRPVAPAAPAVPERPRRIDVHGGGEGPFDEESPEAGMGEIRLAVGRRDGVRAGDIARLVRGKANLARRDVGRIFVRDRFTLVSVREELVDATIQALRDAQLGEIPLAPERGKGLGPSIQPRGPAGEGEAVPPAAATGFEGADE